MTIRDDGETIGLFEPLMVSEGAKQRPALNDLALELAEKSAAFRSSLPPSIADSLSALIRSMNCYYSNLIEGHNTHPVDIEKALAGDYSSDPEKRDLQLEAKAHIAVQEWIDNGGLSGAPTSPEMILEMHRRFCENLPEDLLRVANDDRSEIMILEAGKFRERDVAVGKHVAISAGAIPRFMERMHKVYGNKGRIEPILAAACAHHRLLWVHPFLDGNGRVARLMSYAMLRQTLDTRGLWSIARGLARNEAKYKRHLASCDRPRQSDRDGRGTLSEAALADFVAFFLQTCIDQVEFMEGLMKPEKLRERILLWAREEVQLKALPPKSDALLRAILFQGEVARAEVPDILGLSDRAARRVTSSLIEAGAIKSQSTRSPLNLAFPAKLAGRWMPGLFPDSD
ncbi:Fic family protein [Rhodobacteraceae bacterium RKSG542]|uniref:Fic family protein n=1 Tax=Pseudovibrio flavus TaxID=2529854 RepID=UPI0012BD4D6C|nr:Fic family protein [Pseudovibrio flavus]MTI15756.1 Fic family protein [Pseudovibrio flavus]